MRKTMIMPPSTSPIIALSDVTLTLPTPLELGVWAFQTDQLHESF
jgi:hypothetical protein